jgi:hypothetical protein
VIQVDRAVAVAEQLRLAEAEAETFWPLHAKYGMEMSQIWKCQNAGCCWGIPEIALVHFLGDNSTSRPHRKNQVRQWILKGIAQTKPRMSRGRSTSKPTIGLDGELSRRKSA